MEFCKGINARGFSLAHGMNVALAGVLPSLHIRHTGSLAASILA